MIEFIFHLQDSQSIQHPITARSIAETRTERQDIARPETLPEHSCPAKIEALLLTNTVGGAAKGGFDSACVEGQNPLVRLK